MKDENAITWKVLHSGQIRPYADSIYEFEIESNIPEAEVKRFCLDFLKLAKHESPGGRFDGSCSFPFGMESFYRLTQPEKNKYYYIVCTPYTG